MKERINCYAIPVPSENLWASDIISKQNSSEISADD